MATLEDTARYEAVDEMATQIVAAVAETLKRHGDDPKNRSIIAAGMALAVKKMAVVNPGIKSVLAELLAAD